MNLTIKFGGEAVGTGKRIRENAKFLKTLREEGNNFAVVVSAMGGVTDKLISIAKMAARAEVDRGEEMAKLLDELSELHIGACREAIEKEDVLSQTVSVVEEEIQEFKRSLKRIEDEGKLTDRLLDLVMSFGERLSAPILAGTLRDLGLSSKSLTGHEAGIVTDSNHLDASPFLEMSLDQVGNRLDELLKDDVIPVVTGFIGATEEGVITTLGRGSSDYSASIVGSALSVDEIWIMSDVDGIMTADPKIEPDARLIDKLSYLEATELAHFGSEVLNPKTLEPAMDRNISVRVKNAFNPYDSGTLIVHESEKTDKIVKSVTAIMKVSIVTVWGPSMVGAPMVAVEALENIEEAGINVLMISQSSSQANVSLVVKRESLNKTLRILRESLEDRHPDWRIECDENVSVITCVGAGMKGTPGVAARVFSTMGREKINILMISQGSSELNISFTVNEKDAVDAVRALHEEFKLSSHKAPQN